MAVPDFSSSLIPLFARGREQDLRGTLASMAGIGQGFNQLRQAIEDLQQSQRQKDLLQQQQMFQRDRDDRAARERRINTIAGRANLATPGVIDTIANARTAADLAGLPPAAFEDPVLKRQSDLFKQRQTALRQEQERLDRMARAPRSFNLEQDIARRISRGAGPELQADMMSNMPQARMLANKIRRGEISPQQVLDRFGFVLPTQAEIAAKRDANLRADKFAQDKAEFQRRQAEREGREKRLREAEARRARDSAERLRQAQERINIRKQEVDARILANRDVVKRKDTAEITKAVGQNNDMIRALEREIGDIDQQLPDLMQTALLTGQNPREVAKSMLTRKRGLQQQVQRLTNENRRFRVAALPVVQRAVAEEVSTVLAPVIRLALERGQTPDDIIAGINRNSKKFFQDGRFLSDDDLRELIEFERQQAPGRLSPEVERRVQIFTRTKGTFDGLTDDEREFLDRTRRHSKESARVLKLRRGLEKRRRQFVGQLVRRSVIGDAAR